jgi:hypothetical protein
VRTRELVAALQRLGIRKRDQKVYRAVLVILSADSRFLNALGVVLEFLVRQARARRRR